MSTGTTNIIHALSLVASASSRARRAAEARLRARDLTYAQYLALVALTEHDGLSQAQLAQALETDSTTAMVLRGSLEKKGLVERKDHEGDARVKRIVLTTNGKNAVAHAKPDISNLFSGSGEFFSEGDLKKFVSLLEKLRAFALKAMPVHAAGQAAKRKPGRPKKVADKAAKTPGRKAAAKVAAKPSAKVAAKPSAKIVKKAAAKPAKKAVAKKAVVKKAAVKKAAVKKVVAKKAPAKAVKKVAKR
ncbi:MAG: MarR family winged helix-turn-helix transcriptional regulator [Rectinemataceae bacterium]